MSITSDRRIAATNYEDVGHTPISYTSLKKLRAGGINQFYRYKERELEEEFSASLTLGTLIDEYLLDQEKFGDKYIINSVESPSSPNQQGFARQVAIENVSITDAYKGNYSTKNKSEDKIESAATNLYTKLKEYIEFLPVAEGKEMYSMDDSYALNQIRMNISGHKVASKLFPWITMEDLPDHIEIRTHVQAETKYHGFPIKGELDMVVINHKESTISVYDLKSTRAFLKNFKYEANSYDYFLQAYLYGLLANNCIVTEMMSKHEGIYKLNNPRFIVVRNQGDYGVDIQEIDGKQMITEKTKLANDFEVLEWHYLNKKFKYDRDYYEGDGVTKMDYVEDLNKWRENVNQQLSDE